MFPSVTNDFVLWFENILASIFVGVAIAIFFWLRRDVKKHEKEALKIQDEISKLYELSGSG